MLNRYEIESQGYVVLSVSISKCEQKLNEIPMVRKYPNVFPKDIPEFSPEQEIKFSIELDP